MKREIACRSEACPKKIIRFKHSDSRPMLMSASTLTVNTDESAFRPCLRFLLDHAPAIDDQDVSRVERRRVGGEIGSRSLDVADIAHSPERRDRGELLDDGLRLLLR